MKCLERKENERVPPLPPLPPSSSSAPLIFASDFKTALHSFARSDRKLRRAPPSIRPLSVAPTMRRVPPAPPALSSPAPAAGNQTTPSTSHTFYPSPIDTILAEQGLQRYHIAPPSWRAPWIADATAGGAGSTGGSAVGRSTGRSSSGIATASIAGTAAERKANAWPVFYPPRDGMDEDQMTEQVVKAGYVSKAIVQVRSDFPAFSSPVMSTLTFLSTGRDVLSSPAHLRQAQDDRHSGQPLTTRRSSESESSDSPSGLRVGSFSIPFVYRDPLISFLCSQTLHLPTSFSYHPHRRQA